MARRPYQQQIISNVVDRRAAGIRNQLVVSATGTGKTITFAELIFEMLSGSRMVVIAHREELIDQAAEKIAKVHPSLSIGTEMANRRADGRERVIVGSVQTFSAQKGKRLQHIDPKSVEYLIIDEAHHSTATSYGVPIDYFMANPFTTLVGFTATPNRADGVAMGSVYDEIIFKYDMLDAITDGWLVDVHGFQLKTGTDLSDVGTYKGDFKDKDLARIINTPHRNEAIVKGWIHYCWPRQTIVFTQDIQHAQDLAAAFKRQNIIAVAVWGDDPDRKRKLEAFRRGEIQVLINCQLLIEGFDMWQVECVIPAAPTKSQSKLIQEVGRGTRLQEGVDNLVLWRKTGRLTEEHKTHCLVMDPIDILGRHSLATLPSLFGLSPKLDLQGASAAQAARAIKAAQKQFPNADLSALETLDNLEVYARRADMWRVRFAEEVSGFSELQWTKRGDGTYKIILPKLAGSFTVAEDLVGKFTVSGVMQDRTYSQEKIDSLADAVQLVEKTITSEMPDSLVLLGREQKWMKGPVSKDQMRLLKQFRVPDAEIVHMNRGQAAAWLTQRMNKPKRGQ